MRMKLKATRREGSSFFIGSFAGDMETWHQSEPVPESDTVQEIKVIGWLSCSMHSAGTPPLADVTSGWLCWFGLVCGWLDGAVSIDPKP